MGNGKRRERGRRGEAMVSRQDPLRLALLGTSPVRTGEEKEAPSVSLRETSSMFH